MLAHLDPDSLLISVWQQQCSCMMAEQQQLRLFHAEAVDSVTAGKALWQELEYYSPLPVFGASSQQDNWKHLSRFITA